MMIRLPTSLGFNRGERAETVGYWGLIAAINFDIENVSIGNLVFSANKTDARKVIM